MNKALSHRLRRLENRYFPWLWSCIGGNIRTREGELEPAPRPSERASRNWQCSDRLTPTAVSRG